MDKIYIAASITICSFLLLSLSIAFLWVQTRMRMDTVALITIFTYEISLLLRSVNWIVAIPKLK